MKWAFEEDFIVCNFYLSHIDNWRNCNDEVMTELKNAGFVLRDKASVIMRIQNYQYLHIKKGLSNVAKQTKRIYNVFEQRLNNSSLKKNIQELIKHHYISDAIEKPEYIFVPEDLNVKKFLYTEPLEPSFKDILINFIQRSGKKDSEIYKESLVSRDKFNHIFNKRKTNNSSDYIGVSKRTIMQLCFGLKLSYDEAVVLMESAGYAFRKNDLTDVIVVIYLKNKNHNIDDVNCTLYENGLAAFSMSRSDM